MIITVCSLKLREFIKCLRELLSNTEKNSLLNLNDRNMNLALDLKVIGIT